MNLDFFKKYYNFDEFKVNNAYIKNSVLHLELSTVVKLELIANGYRPEMDVEQKKTYLFKTKEEDISFEKISNWCLVQENNICYIILDNTKIEIIDDEISII